MAYTSKLIPFILKWEGGFSNHPLDKGGPTNKGITFSTFRSFHPAATVNDLKNMTEDQWFAIFIDGYWDPWRADEIKNQSVANIVVDWAWASGVTTSIKQVQRILGVKVDGIVGRQTLSALNNTNQQELFNDIRNARYRFIEAIIERDPSQAVFRRGWRNRIDDIHFEH